MFFPVKDDNPTRRPAVVTILFIIINVAVFLFQSYFGDFQGQNQLDYYILRNAFVPWEVTHGKSIREMERQDLVYLAEGVYQERLPVLRQLLIGYQIREISPWLSILTSIFMHGGWMHLLGNMLFLWIFGNNIEDYLGHFGFIMFYLVCGAGATIAHLLFNFNSLEPVVGASGAISGIMGAYLILYPHAKVKTLVFIFIIITFVDLPAGLFLVIWFLFQFTHAGTGSYVAWLAHVGGFLIGLGIIWQIRKRKPVMQILANDSHDGFNDDDGDDFYR